MLVLMVTVVKMSMAVMVMMVALVGRPLAMRVWVVRYNSAKSLGRKSALVREAFYIQRTLLDFVELMPRVGGRGWYWKRPGLGLLGRSVGPEPREDISNTGDAPVPRVHSFVSWSLYEHECSKKNLMSSTIRFPLWGVGGECCAGL